jgi:dihydrofolate reductase
MRLVRYGGAMSLDGYIATPTGAYDWIVHDPEMDFAAMMSRFDTFLIGRKTFDTMGRSLKLMPRNTTSIIFSRTLQQSDYPNLIISDNPIRIVTDLRTQPGKDIALFGGGDLFRSLLQANLVDRVEVSLIPVLLGAGVPFLPPPAPHTKLKLLKHRLYEKTGIIGLEYEVLRSQIEQSTTEVSS